MSILRVKSDENIRAASELVNQHECYAASVHCSYYACFQLIAYVLKVEHDVRDTRQWRDLGSTDGSHQHTINMLFNELQSFDRAQKPATRNSTHFNRYMNTLKNRRRNADYDEVEIDESFGKAAFGEATTVRELLFDVYGLTPTSYGSNQNKVVSLLQVLSAQFPEMTFTYGYDELVNQHIVEVAPTALYDSDDYMDAESDTVGTFIDEFPAEGLLFTSNNPHIRKPQSIFIVPKPSSEGDYNNLVPSRLLVYGQEGYFTIIEENGHELGVGEYNYAMAA